MTTDQFLERLDRFAKAMSTYETTIRTLAEERDALRDELANMRAVAKAVANDLAQERLSHLDTKKDFRDQRELLCDLWEWIDAIPAWYRKGECPVRLNCNKGPDCACCASVRAYEARLREQATARDAGDA